jgi:GTP-binding protein
MDSNELERERGITILAKTTGVRYHGVKINIVDTPGHSDFGGEVERALKMVDGVMLLVDASEGPLPQTRYVLMKALEARLPPIVVINKIDRPDARIQEVLNEVYDLFIDLDATEDQLDFPVIYTNAAGHRQDDRRTTHRPAAAVRPFSSTFPPLGRSRRRCSCRSPTSTTASTWAGWRSAASSAGTLRLGDEVSIAKLDGTFQKTRITKLYSFEGLKRVDETIGEAGRHAGHRGRGRHHDRRDYHPCRDPEAAAAHPIDEPTIAMTFTINTSPFAGREGQYVTSRNLRDRLDKELLTNVSIRVEEEAVPTRSR